MITSTCDLVDRVLTSAANRYASAQPLPLRSVNATTNARGKRD